MDNNSLSSTITSNPSLPLKEKLLEVLESKEGSLEALSKLLDLETNTSQYKTVHELVQDYEEQHGQISLEKWRNIFESLGYVKDFLGVIEQFNRQRCCPSVVISSKEPSSEEAKLPPHDLHLLAMPAEFDYNQLPVNELENGCSDNPMTVGVTEGPVDPPMPVKVLSHEDWPSWSLPPPPPPPEQVKQSEDNSANQDNHTGSATVPGAVADDSGYFSVQNGVHNINASSDDHDSLSPPSSIFGQTNQQNELVDDMLSLSPSNSVISEADQCIDMPDINQSSLLSDSSIVSVTDQQLQNEASEKEQDNQACASASSNPGADISSQGSDAHARPAATCTGMGSSGLERNFSGCLPPSHLPCHLPHHVHSPTAGCGNELHGSQLQATGSPAENYDVRENIGLLDELQKENEELHFTVLFLAQELRKKTSLCDNLQDEICHLHQELLECRAECTDLQQQKEELTCHLNGSTVLEAESQRLITMTQEMHAWKQEECNRLEEHIRQSDAKYNDAISNMEALHKEKQEFTELLVSLRRQLEEVQQGHEQFRDQELRRLRMEHDRQMEDICLAFNNAETDTVKVLKLKLKREKSKRKRMEERNKEVCKESERLQALVRQLTLEEVSNASYAGICSDDVDWQNCDLREDESDSNSSSSDVEADNPAGSSSQQSASDESDDEEFFDALDHLF